MSDVQRPETSLQKVLGSGGKSKHEITAEQVAAAAQVLGLSFSGHEREFMLELVNQRADEYDTIRNVPLDNEVWPPLYFDPRPPGQRAPAATSARGRTRLSTPPAVERPVDLETVAFWPVTHLAELLRTRQVTAVELAGMYLERLRRYGPKLECVVTLTEDLAMQQARRADDEIAAGRYRGPLHGIPWGAKDLLAVKGYKTTWGVMPYKEQVIDTDATVVTRLEEAGAVLLGKLTLGALAYGDVWFGGKTRNPWNLEEGSSGSSAGPGAATAAGLVGFAIGTETLGSIVSPSARCGVTGLRPTFGRVSRDGAMALSWTMDKIGPMCRAVEDCALVFDAIYGPDGLDPFVVDAPFAWNPALDVTGLRVGYLKSAFDEERDGKTNDEAVLDVLRSLGLGLIPIELPQYELSPLFIILVAEAAAAFDEITRGDLDDSMRWQDKDAWPNMFRQARLIPAVEYIQANRIRTRIMMEMAALMQRVDVYVAPSFSGNLIMNNLTGHPAVVLPNGFNQSGSPTSITFTGNLYREHEVLALAKAYQDATDFHLRHPALEAEA